jgi:hypothetical protein
MNMLRSTLRRDVVALTGGLLLAGLITRGTAAAAPGTTGRPVPGATTFHGSGYDLSVPSGWHTSVAGGPGLRQTTFAGRPTHSNLTVTTASGHYLTGQSARSMFLSTRAAAHQGPRRGWPTTLTLTRWHVPGAISAWLLTDIRARASTPEAYRELIVTVKGHEYEVAALVLGNHPFLPDDPTGLTYLESFTLTR